MREEHMFVALGIFVLLVGGVMLLDNNTVGRAFYVEDESLYDVIAGIQQNPAGYEVVMHQDATGREVQSVAALANTLNVPQIRLYNEVFSQDFKVFAGSEQSMFDTFGLEVSGDAMITYTTEDQALQLLIYGRNHEFLSRVNTLLKNADPAQFNTDCVELRGNELQSC